VPFVTVPRGFGNLFAHAFNQPEAVEDVVDLLARGRVIHADVGACNGELFLCQQGYGLIAEVQRAVESVRVPRARTRRWLAYYRAALHRIDDQPSTPFRVVVDGRVVAADAALVIVANDKSYGAWLPLTPDASPVDGLFDVFVMRGSSRRHVFLELLRRHLRMPGVNDAVLCRGRRVSVSRPRAARDRLEILSHRLPIVVAPETAANLTRGLGRRQTAVVLGQGPAARGTRQRGYRRARPGPAAAPVTRPMANPRLTVPRGSR
jgi:hypothetical protein